MARHARHAKKEMRKLAGARRNDTKAGVLFKKCIDVLSSRSFASRLPLVAGPRGLFRAALRL